MQKTHDANLQSGSMWRATRFDEEGRISECAGFPAKVKDLVFY
jgi:hypothetical protein